MVNWRAGKNIPARAIMPVCGVDVLVAGVDCDATAGVRVNGFLQTSNPRIYAAGDACLEHKFTHPLTLLHASWFRTRCSSVAGD